MDADHRTDLLALCGDPCVPQLAGTAALAHPFGRRPAFAVRVGDADVAAEADHVAEAQRAQKGEQLLVAKAAVGQDRHPDIRRQRLGQAAQAGVRVVVAPGRDLVFPDGKPDQRRGPAVAGDQAQHQRRLPVMVEVRPVHRHQDVALRADLPRHPAGKAVPHVDAGVAQQPVHLLDRMLGDQAAGLRQSLADHCHRQRCARHHPERGTCQRIDPFGMQVRPVEPANEAPNLS